MVNDPRVLALVGAVLFVSLIIFVVRIYVNIKRLNQSFAKLGFVVREDAKKYFDDAAGEIVATNEKFADTYKQIVISGTKEVLRDSSSIMEQALTDAQNEAGKVVLRAQEDARNIVQAAQEQAGKEYDKKMNQATDALSWTLEQYLRQRYSVAEHEELVNRIIEGYVNERRK